MESELRSSHVEKDEKAAVMGKPGKAANRAEIPLVFIEGVVQCDEGDVGENERRVRG